MKASLSVKLLAGAVLAVAGLGVASAAHARSNVYFSIGLPGAPVYVEPAPVYVQPRPVYAQPQPVYEQFPAYEQLPVYAEAEPIYLGPAPFYFRSYGEERAWRRAEWQRREFRNHRGGWEQHEGRHGHRD